MSFLIIILISISLSMDAFSLALVYGTKNNIKVYKLSTLVGIFHFFMPILGYIVSLFITNNFFNVNKITRLLFIFIGIQMIIETFKKNDNLNIINFIDYILFSLAVSIDSFSIGISLSKSNYIICSIFFSIFSFLFTILGLKLGKIVKEFIGKISTLLGGIIIIIIGFTCY